MNFLAHFYLSFDDPEILVGNFIGDHVKGNKYNNYPDRIRQGILLHRHIDTYTDSHQATQNSNDLLRDRYRKFAPIITDIFYDHFLANNWKTYSSTDLDSSVANFYASLNAQVEEMPERSQHTLYWMERGDWLSSYKEISGIGQALEGMNRRTRGISGMHTATEELKEHYEEFEENFKSFFPELITSTRDWTKKKRA